MQPVLKWGEGATNNAIIAHAAHLADAVILIDNFKPNTGGGAKAFIALLHNIVEGAERERLTRTSHLRSARELHAWPLTTGEDVPREDAASMVRMLVLHFDWPAGQTNAALAEAQSNAANMPALMRAWVDWVASHRNEVKALGATIEDRRDRWAKWLLQRRPKTVNILRLASNLAVQEIAWESMRQCPETAFITDGRERSHSRGLELVALQMGSATAESLDANVWIEALADMLGSNAAYLQSLNGLMPNSDPGRNAKLIGWQDEDFYYLLPTATHELIFEAARRAGQPIGVSTTTLYRQMESLGALVSGDERSTTVARIYGNNRRVIKLRRSLVVAAENTDVDEVDGYEV